MDNRFSLPSALSRSASSTKLLCKKANFLSTLLVRPCYRLRPGCFRHAAGSSGCGSCRHRRPVGAGHAAAASPLSNERNAAMRRRPVRSLPARNLCRSVFSVSGHRTERDQPSRVSRLTADGVIRGVAVALMLRAGFALDKGEQLCTLPARRHSPRPDLESVHMRHSCAAR
jgi:hypothetical protein